MIRHILSASVLFAAPALWAVDAGLAPLGFSGALSTPMATSLATGEAALGFTNYLDAQDINSNGYNYLGGVGVLPGVELFARLAARTVANNCFLEQCGVRDLSASAKWVLPDAAPLLPVAWRSWLPRVAVGATDVGGSVVLFKTNYGVASWNREHWAVSAGLSQTTKGKRESARLSGAFGSLVVQPYPWLQGIVEHDGTDPQAGIRLLSPKGLLGRVRLQGEMRTGAPRDLEASRSVWFGAALKLALGGNTQEPLYRQAWVPGARAEALAAKPLPVEPLPLESMPVAPASQAVTAQQQTEPQTPALVVLRSDVLVEKLLAAGFENVSVTARAEGGWQLRLENQAYAWNDVDALGVALGEYANWSVQQPAAVQLDLLHQGLTSLRVSSDTSCLNVWLQRGERCAAGVLRFPSETGLSAVQDWWREVGNTPEGANSILYKPRVELAPVLNYTVGSEFGSMDYSLGLATSVEVPVLWRGLLAEARHITPAYETKDYREGGAFAASALTSGLDRIMLHQYVQGPLGLSAHAAAGRVLTDFTGSLLETRWESPQGQHKVTALVASLENNQQFMAKPLLLGYRYQLPNYPMQLSLKAGEFFDADKGFVASSRFLFDDTFVSVFYRSTKRADEAEAFKFLGVELSVPLTLRQNRPGRFVQLRGSAEFSQGLQTRIGVANGNPLAGAGQRGRFANAPLSLDQRVYNRDRMAPAYLLQQLPRLRNAYERYVATAWQYDVPVVTEVSPFIPWQ